MELIKGLIGILIIAEIILTGYTAYTNHFHQTTFCVFGAACNDVQKSAYGAIAGIPVSDLGFIAFVLLFIIYLTSYKQKPSKTFIALTLLGSLGSLYFLSIQFFVLTKICSTCFVIDTFMLIITALALYAHKKS